MKEKNIKQHRGIHLEGADLRGANLKNTNLREVNLQGANLEGINLENADLREASLNGANLQGANLVGAKIENLAELKIINENSKKEYKAFLVGIGREKYYVILIFIKLGCHSRSFKSAYN